MDTRLIQAAQKARANAYAPYSVYRVGAAILGADGQIYTGCNVENVSYGLTICAERTAIANMVLAGCQEIKEVAVATEDGGTPCGMCRQTLTEFAPDPTKVWILSVNEAGETEIFRLSELCPMPFKSDIKKK